MANPWFRLYAEFSTDQKVQMLSESDQRRLIMLFCIRCNGNVTLQDEEVTFLLRISNEEWQVTKALFVAKGFINNDNELLNWDKRQFVSDSSAERVARHRAKKKQTCNVTVTPPEQNRTDTEQNRVKEKNKKENSDFETFWSAYPKKTAKQEALNAWKKHKPPIDEVLKALLWQTKLQQWQDRQFIPYASTYLNKERWKDEEITEVRAPPNLTRQQQDAVNARSIFGVQSHERIIEGTAEFLEIDKPAIAAKLG